MRIGMNFRGVEFSIRWDGLMIFGLLDHVVGFYKELVDFIEFLILIFFHLCVPIFSIFDAIGFPRRFSALLRLVSSLLVSSMIFSFNFWRFKGITIASVILMLPIQSR